MKKLIVFALSIGVLGAVFLKDISGLFLYGISGFVIGFLVLQFFNYRCKVCKSWFSYKTVSKNYSNIVGSPNPWNDDVTADEVHTLECKKCKNKVSKTYRVTKNIRGSGRL